MRRAEARGRGVVARAGAIETIGEFADRAQAVTANAHAALVTSKVFDVADAAATMTFANMLVISVTGLRINL